MPDHLTEKEIERFKTAIEASGLDYGMMKTALTKEPEKPLFSMVEDFKKISTLASTVLTSAENNPGQDQETMNRFLAALKPLIRRPRKK